MGPIAGSATDMPYCYTVIDKEKLDIRNACMDKSHNACGHAYQSAAKGMLGQLKGPAGQIFFT